MAAMMKNPGPVPGLVSASDSSGDDGKYHATSLPIRGPTTASSLNHRADPLLLALSSPAVLGADSLPEADDSDTPAEAKELDEEAAAAEKRTGSTNVGVSWPH